MRVWQVVIGFIFCGLGCSLAAEADGAKFAYKAPVVGPGLFSDELGMMDKEREEYALNIANYVGNRIAESKGSAESLAQGRRLIALSLHLSPRNRKAVVMNFNSKKESCHRSSMAITAQKYSHACCSPVASCC